MFFFAMLFACLPIQQTDGSEQAPDSAAKSVIEEFIIAKGGEAAIRKIKNTSVKGKVFSKNELIGEFESYQTADRHLSIERFPDGGERRSGTNGKIAWRIDVAGEPTLLTGQEAQDFIRHNKTLHGSLEWQNQFDVILYAGKKTIQSVETHHLIFVAPDNRQINRYFSVKSGLLTREEQVTGKGTNMLVQISEIGNYVREKNGVLGSRQRVNHLNHQGKKYSVEFKVESVETNTLTDDSIFAVPESVAKLVDNDPFASSDDLFGGSDDVE